MPKKNKTHGKKKFLVMFIGLIIFFLVVFALVFYFDVIKHQLKKPSSPVENFQNTNGDLVNSNINLIGENNTISPDYHSVYEKENSVYITCLNGKITIKYQDQTKEMTRSDYDDLWSVLNENDVWNLVTERGPMAAGAGTQTVEISLGNNSSELKSNSFEVMNPDTKNKKQYIIIKKIEDLKTKYFPS